MTGYRTTLRATGLAAAAALALGAGTAGADALKLKLHSFGSPKQPETKWIFEPLKKDFERHSGNTMTIQVYYGMALGGKPRDLIVSLAHDLSGLGST